jgi:aminoglycoside phosphotransferase (APT) family kinase protein
LFHDRVAEAQAQPLDGTALAGEFEDSAARRLIGRSSVLSAFDVLAGEARRHHGAPAAVGATHGDCSLVNLLVTGDGRVALLDPNLVPGPLLEDAAKMLVALALRRARVLTLGALGETGLEQAEAAFLEGYGPHDGGLLRLLRGVAVVRRQRELSRRLGGAARPLLAVLGWAAARELERSAG